MQEGLTINVSWEYFLGVVAALIGIAWYSGRKFSRIETSIEWLKATVNEMKVGLDNQKAPAFVTESPVNLNARGKEWLEKSGLKSFIDNQKIDLMQICEDKRSLNPYDIQEFIFDYFDNLEFPEEIAGKLKKFAFNQGTTMNMIRRIGGIYFRNICLDEFGMDLGEIDNHEPTPA